MSEDAKARARRRAEERQEGSWYKLVVGNNCFRILPTPESKTTPALFYEYATHRDVGPKKVQVRCGKDPESRKGKCWLCDTKIPELQRKGHASRAALLASGPVLVLQVAKVSDSGKFKGPLIWSPSKTVGNQILASIIGAKKRTYEDPKKGYNITISRTGTTRNDTRYGLIEPDDEPSIVPASIINELKPFSELVEIPTYDEAKQKAAYLGQDLSAADEDEEEAEDEEEGEEESEDEEEEEEEEGEGEEEEEEDPAPKKPVKKPAKTGKKKPEPEPEEEEEEADEEESEEEEEEEEPPAKPPKKKPAPPAKPGKKKPAPEPEEEEEEAEEEAEEEDEPDDIDLDEEEESDEEESEEEEEEDEPPAKPGKKKPIPPPVRRRK